jgi:hypothetical protein
MTTLELNRTEITERRMPALAVVKQLDVFEPFEKTRIKAGFGIGVDPENALILRFSSEISQSYPATISVVPI